MDGDISSDPNALGNYMDNGGSVAIIGFQKEKAAMQQSLKSMSQELAQSGNDPSKVTMNSIIRAVNCK